jgi:Na+-driven multidrug efflux pump
MAPVAVLGMVAQSTCLVTHHTSTVRYAIAAAVASNCLCDAILTPIVGMDGAAMAKVAANGSEAVIFTKTSTFDHARLEKQGNFYGK